MLGFTQLSVIQNNDWTIQTKIASWLNTIRTQCECLTYDLSVSNADGLLLIWLGYFSSDFEFIFCCCCCCEWIEGSWLPALVPLVKLFRLTESWRSSDTFFKWENEQS